MISSKGPDRPAAAGVSGTRLDAALANDAPPFEGLVWHVAMTAPTRELFAMVNLLRHGFSVWLPLCTVTVRHARRIDHRREPFFPGYLFVGRRGPEHPKGEQAFAPITTTLGVASVIRTDGARPAIIARHWLDHVAAILAQHEAQARALRTGKPVCPFAQGQRLQVTEGPFAGLDAVCLMPAGRRVAVLLAFMGQELRAVLQPHMLRAVE